MGFVMGRWAGLMSFEVNTLFLLTIDVEAILGLLLLLVWVQNTRVTRSPGGHPRI